MQAARHNARQLLTLYTRVDEQRAEPKPRKLVGAGARFDRRNLTLGQRAAAPRHLGLKLQCFILIAYSGSAVWLPPTELAPVLYIQQLMAEE